MKIGILSGIVLALAASLVQADAEQAGTPSVDDWRVDRYEQTWPVGEATSIEVSNPWGDIAVRGSASQEVYLLANTQRHRDDPRAFDLQASPTSGVFTIHVGFEEGEGGEAPSAWSRRRTDITVFVPASASTRFSTDSGTLEVRGTRGPVRVLSTSGDLRLRVHGAVTARTEHGDVLAQFLATDWKQPVEISTRTGDIRVEMPRGGRADVTIETRGPITSDYSMKIERAEGAQLKRAKVDAGGGQTISLHSHRGAIQILQTLVPEI
jgi:hypothetical protein